MTLEEFKTSIEQKTVGNQLVIFVYEDVPFVADSIFVKLQKSKNKKYNILNQLIVYQVELQIYLECPM